MTRSKSRSSTASWYMNSGQMPRSRLAVCGSLPGRSARVGNWSAISVGASQKRDRLGREPFTAAGEAELVGRGRAHRDAIDIDPHCTCEPSAHRDAHVGDPRPLANQDAVRVDELEAAHADDLVAPLEKPDRGGVEPLRIG